MAQTIIFNVYTIGNPHAEAEATAQLRKIPGVLRVDVLDRDYDSAEVMVRVLHDGTVNWRTLEDCEVPC